MPDFGCNLFLALSTWTRFSGRMRDVCGTLESISSGSTCNRVIQGVIQGGGRGALVGLQEHNPVDSDPFSKPWQVCVQASLFRWLAFGAASVLF